eukprot:TRINITY_DN698_c1_g1_i6.p1 TRINITY_DN698_c1_g1~~TRINITY_DN698_c1_g1_i6.p1  ORF type:complete len:744 (+),score=136.39 TRINITY_DN698_c1_g1_i6:197-2428(+)
MLNPPTVLLVDLLAHYVDFLPLHHQQRRSSFFLAGVVAMLLSMFLLSVWNALATILLRVSSLLRRQRPFPVFVKNLQGGSLCIRVDGDTTVSHLRRVVEQRSGLGGVGKHVRLWYGTKCLDTVPDRNATVSSLEIHRDSTLEIRGWLCGGGKTRTKGKTAAASTSGAREPSKWVFVVLRQEDGDDIINNSSIKIKNEEDVSDLKERLREDYSGGSNPDFKANYITVYGCDKNTYDSHEQWWLESTAKNVDASKLLKLMDRTQLLLYECFLAVVKTPPVAFTPSLKREHIKTPSSKDEKTRSLYTRDANGDHTMLAHPSFVRVAQILHNQTEHIDGRLNLLGSLLYDAVIMDAVPSYGPLTEQSLCKNDEPARTSYLSLLLQQSSPRLAWIHQARLPPHCTCDIAIYVPSQDYGFLSVGVIEVGKESPVKKDLQAYGYIKNLTCLLNDENYPLMLGVTLSVLNMPQVRVHGYYEHQRCRLADVLLFTGEASPDVLGRVVYALEAFSQLLIQAYPLTEPFPERSDGNVRVAYEDDRVYKLYDYQGRAVLDPRHPNLSIAEYPEGRLLVDGEDLKVLSYKLISGSHTATSTTQVADVVKHLARLHDRGYVHGDIRASNIVFGAASRLIDYDFAGKCGVTRYPSGFCTSINDGKRHPSAQGLRPITIEHDCYSLACVFEQYTCEGDNGWWEDALREIKEGRVSLFAISVRIADHPGPLTRKPGEETAAPTQTGSPKRTGGTLPPLFP